jgi:hypothetical protein
MVTLVNRAKVSTATTGTGTITLGSAESGYQTFADAGVVDANVVRYVIEDGTNWEIGTGTYTATGTTLSRTVLESSNADAAINLSGSAVVFVGAAAEDLAPVDTTNLEVTNINAKDGTASATIANITGVLTVASSVLTTTEINGGTITGITDLAVADGGTGASTAPVALTNLGLTATAAEINILDGVTASTAELNILDGVTATAAELNKLDGATATTAQLNFVTGVTSAIQTQLGTKAPLASPALTGTPTAPTAAAATNTTQIATTAYTRTAIPNVLNASGLAPLYACRAWVNFNGTGTVAILASGNVSSITDNGTGDYTVNFATAMPDANFCYTHAYSAEVNVQHAVGFFHAISTGSVRVQHYNSANSVNKADKALVCIAIFR